MRFPLRTVSSVWPAFLLLFAISGASPLAAQKEHKDHSDAAKQARRHERARKDAALPAVLMWDAGDHAQNLDLFDGPGGKKHALDPNGTYTFKEEILSQYNPKFDVIDQNGVRWRVKLGRKPSRRRRRLD
jgi:hypothetical protein